MRCMIRHKTKVWYAGYVSDAPILDSSNYDTGEKTVTYGNPVGIEAHVSPARGSAETEQFGDQVDYDRVIVVDDPNIGITEQSILWIETAPSIETNGSLSLTEDGDPVTPWDYVVVRVARSQNFAQVAVKKVVVA